MLKKVKDLESERKKERSDSVVTTLVSQSIKKKVKEENPNLYYQMALNDIQTTEAPHFPRGASCALRGRLAGTPGGVPCRPSSWLLGKGWEC